MLNHEDIMKLGAEEAELSRATAQRLYKKYHDTANEIY